ncbi:GNAT family N-acetyltransferase [Paenochrobactrum pullorum]|uniref:GNAT family N-acetyltransferase n=1 Tax=Paenochrobactrum pullorum TaxID=1324351 RepID=UPI0035BBC2EC
MVVHPLLEEKAQEAERAAKSVFACALMPENGTPYALQPEIPRKLDIYAASAGYELRDELDFLSKRTIEPNIFFNARFLAPAMPRLEDRIVRFMVMRDENEERSRLRFVMPYTMERLGWKTGQAMMRAWTTGFSPQGTPLIDQDDPSGVVNDLFDILNRKHLQLPQVLVFPHMRSHGATTQVIRDVADKRKLPMHVLENEPRPFLISDLAGDAYCREYIDAGHNMQLQYLSESLSELGAVRYVVSTSIDDIRLKFERFILLENRTERARHKTKIVGDRYREAFAREAVNNLAERGAVQLHSLELNDKTIAAVIIFIENSDAWIWKSAYAEGLHAFSPDVLLLRDVIKNTIDDPNIKRMDACVLAEHPLIESMFNTCEPQETLIVGLNRDAHRLVEKAAVKVRLRNQSSALKQAYRKLIRHFK